MNPPETQSAVLCKEWFGRVFDLLASVGGAPEFMRADFIHHHTSDQPCDEYRFQGTLGFGGKYWRKTNRVTCYIEDEDCNRLRTLSVLNGELANHTANGFPFARRTIFPLRQCLNS